MLPAFFAVAFIGMFFGIFAGMVAGDAFVWITVVTIFIVCLIILLCLFFRFYLSMWFIVDQDRGVIDSMGESWQVSSGNILKLLGSFIVFFLPLAVCMFVCMYIFGIDIESVNGVIIYNVMYVPLIALPWVGGTLAYLQLTGQSHCLEWNAESETICDIMAP